MTAEQNRIYEIFEKSGRSDLSWKARQSVAETCGEEMATQVHAIYDEAMHRRWTGARRPSIRPCRFLHDLLGSKYPWLSVEARRKINDAFLMTWK